jgi:hypothetical protein
MLLDKYIEVKISKKNIEHFSKYYKNISIKDVLRIRTDELQSGSNKRIKVKCDNCYIENFIKYQSYFKNITSSEKHPIYTCVKCSHIKIKSTNMDKYGVEYYSKTDEYNARFIKTMKQRYSVEYPTQSKEILNKIKNTNLQRYGVDNIFKDNSYIKDKFIEKYGVDHPSKVKEIYDRVKESNLRSTGYESPLSSPEIRERIKETNKRLYGSNTPSQSNILRDFIITKDDEYIEYNSDKGISLMSCKKNHIYEITSSNYHGRKRDCVPLCTVCNPISSTSKEKELYEFISSMYNGSIIRSFKDKRIEIDVYIPELKIGFEFNGLYWHSEEYKDRDYHIKKTEYFKDKGIRIIHIWEDDWVNKTDIIKSQVKNWLGLTTHKIYARKCIIKEVSDIKIIRKFLDENHIQGFVTSSKKIGLYYDDVLVSIMVFDHREGRDKMNDNQWNLSRFCNNKNTVVIGGASRLLKYFMKSYSPVRIISYADRDWSEGNVYYNLGFDMVKSSKPDYKYIVNSKRVHKSRYKKSNLETNLTENDYMKANSYKKIWDCGKIKFEIII